MDVNTTAARRDFSGTSAAVHNTTFPPAIPSTSNLSRFATRKCRSFGAKSPRFHPPSSLKLSYRTRTRPGPRCPPRPGSGRGPAARLGSGKEVLAAPQPFHCHPRTPASQPPNNHPRHSNHPHPERLGRHPRRPLATTGRIQLIDHRAPFIVAPSIDPDTIQKVGILFAVL